MGNSKIITFILVGSRDGYLVEEIYSTSTNLLNYGNAIILREPEQFINLYHYFAEGYEFRLLIHLGLRDNSNDVGIKISSAITDELNIIPEYFTRESTIFSQVEDKSFIIYRDKTVYNFDFMNRKSFIDRLPKYIKGESMSKINTKSGTNDSKPKIFVGSSTDGLEYAEAVQRIINSKKLNYDVDIWIDVFGKDNSTNIEVLETALKTYEYSIFIFSPDDTIKLSNTDEEKKIPRDNVIFEYGLFMGKNGRPNTFFIVPENWKDLRILSDIEGLNRFSYTENENKDSAVRPKCTDILKAIQKN